MMGVLFIRLSYASEKVANWHLESRRGRMRFRATPTARKVAMPEIIDIERELALLMLQS
jgi:hypothetical protein